MTTSDTPETGRGRPDDIPEDVWAAAADAAAHVYSPDNPAHAWVTLVIARAILAERTRLLAALREAGEALDWYSARAAGCRKITSEGDTARRELNDDGGSRARTAHTRIKELMNG